MPLQVWSGLCASRYFAGRLRGVLVEAALESSGKMSPSL